MSLGERMQFVADTARCTVWRDGSRWTVTRDEARGEPVMQFDYRNLARSGDSVLSFAAHIPDSNDGVELEYIDEATQASKAYARLNISSWSVVAGASANPKKFTMLGCATQAQAENRAHLEARRLLYQRTFVADTALCDALSAGLGDLVRWVDPDDFGGDGLQGGEVLAVSGDVLTLSEPVSFGAEASGRMHLTGEDGGPLGPPVVCTPVVGNPRAVRLAAVPVGLFVAGPGRQCGSRYAFAAGLTEDEMAAAGLFVLVDASPAGGDTVSVSLASYSARLYEMDP
jgi:hypothetical protein